MPVVVEGTSCCWGTGLDVAAGGYWAVVRERLRRVILRFLGCLIRFAPWIIESRPIQRRLKCFFFRFEAAWVSFKFVFCARMLFWVSLAAFPCRIVFVRVESNTCFRLASLQHITSSRESVGSGCWDTELDVAAGNCWSICRNWLQMRKTKAWMVDTGYQLFSTDAALTENSSKNDKQYMRRNKPVRWQSTWMWIWNRLWRRWSKCNHHGDQDTTSALASDGYNQLLGYNNICEELATEAAPKECIVTMFIKIQPPHRLVKRCNNIYEAIATNAAKKEGIVMTVIKIQHLSRLLKATITFTKSSPLMLHQRKALWWWSKYNIYNNIY